MDLILNYLDPALLDKAYKAGSRSLARAMCTKGDENIITSSSSGSGGGIMTTIIDGSSERICELAMDPDLWQRHSLWRQGTSIFFLTWLSSSLFYLLFGTACYYVNFDRALTRHPKFRPRQVPAEVTASLWALLVLNTLTVPIFVAQIRGLARIYPLGAASPWYEVAQYPLFVLFSDTAMYWLHRLFHRPMLFRLAHHKHHRFVVPTPFSAYAFDPLEAWVMSLPIYAYSFLWPMSDVAQLVVFFVTNLWTFLLHDDRDQFHTVHHKTVERNFGQFLVLWDRLGGTYADPNVFFSSVRDKRVKPIF